MPKKLKFEKTFQNANVRIYDNHYSVITFFEVNIDNFGYKINRPKYYQVQKNRKKIQNYDNLEKALRRMMIEANNELQLLFNILEI